MGRGLRRAPAAGLTMALTAARRLAEMAITQMEAHGADEVGRRAEGGLWGMLTIPWADRFGDRA